jgi:TRAP transporter 4TM/12TM fusion protein
LATPELESRGLGGIAPPGARFVAMTLAAAMTCASIAWALDINLYLGLDLYPAQFFAVILTLALPLVFIALPVRRHEARDEVPWYDWLLAVVGFLAAGYIFWEYQRLVDLILLRPWDAITAGAITIVLALEGLRRTTGNTLPIIAAAFILYALLGSYLPGGLQARPNDIGKLTGYLSFDVNGVLGLPLAVASTIVFAFLYFGALLNVSGGSRFFTDIAMLAMGRFRGGPAKIAVLGSGLFGSVSGSAVANVAATGVVTIPMIKRGGYPAHRAGAIEAVASTGGQLMPPVMGATAFLMAEFLEIPYSEVVLAALVPALIYYIALFIQADLEAARLGLAGVPKDEMPEKTSTLKGLHFALPFVVLIVALFKYNQSPQLAALLGAGVLMVLSLIFGYRGRRPHWRAFFSSLHQAGYAVLDIVMVCVAAGIVIGVLGISGLGFNLTLALVQIGEGSLTILLLLSAVVCIILGMGLPTLGVYVLLAALVRCLCAAGGPGCTRPGQGRRRADRGTLIRHVFRHDVHDHAAGGDRRLCSRRDRTVRPHGDRLVGRALWLDGLCGAVPVRAVARPFADRRYAGDRPGGHYRGNGRLAGLDRPVGLFHACLETGSTGGFRPGRWIGAGSGGCLFGRRTDRPVGRLGRSCPGLLRIFYRPAEPRGQTGRMNRSHWRAPP